MENKAHSLAAGLFIMCITALLIAMTIWLNRDTTNTKIYEIITKDSITGLQAQAAVTYKGVSVGKVVEIGLAPPDRNAVQIKIALKPETPITPATYATLGFQGVTGLSYIQLDEDQKIASAIASLNLEKSQSGNTLIPLRPNILGQMQDMVGELSIKVGEITDGVNQILRGENQKILTELLQESTNAAKNISQLAKNTDKALQAQFGEDRSSFPELVNMTTKAMKTLDRVAKQTDGLISNINQTTKQTQNVITTVTNSTLPDIQNLATNATQTLERVDIVISEIQENPRALIFGAGEIPAGPGEEGFKERIEKTK